jgi:hypothetical protein
MSNQVPPLKSGQGVSMRVVVARSCLQDLVCAAEYLFLAGWCWGSCVCFEAWVGCALGAQICYTALPGLGYTSTPSTMQL